MKPKPRITNSPFGYTGDITTDTLSADELQDPLIETPKSRSMDPAGEWGNDDVLRSSIYTTDLRQGHHTTWKTRCIELTIIS